MAGGTTIQTYASLAKRIRALPARAGRTVVVAVDGPAGAGKSTFARGLGEALDVPVVKLDDIYPGWDGLDQAAQLLVELVLKPLVEGRAARYRRYDWDAKRYAEDREVPAAPILIIEGVQSGSVLASPYVSLLIWVTAPANVRIARGIERDGEAFRSHWENWIAAEERTFESERTRERADVRVDGAPAQSHHPTLEFVLAPSS